MTASPEPIAVGSLPDTHDDAAHGAVDPSGALVGALFVVALALRPQISAIGPLVPGLIEEFGPSHAFIGLLTAIPVLCMGIFALVGPVGRGLVREPLRDRGVGGDPRRIGRPAGRRARGRARAARDRRRRDRRRRHRTDPSDVRPRPDAGADGGRDLVVCGRHDRRRRARRRPRGAARDRIRRLARRAPRDRRPLDRVHRRLAGGGSLAPACGPGQDGGAGERGPATAAARAATPPDPSADRLGDRAPVRAPVDAVLRPDGLARLGVHRARLGAADRRAPRGRGQPRKPRRDHRRALGGAPRPLAGA